MSETILECPRCGCADLIVNKGAQEDARIECGDTHKRGCGVFVSSSSWDEVVGIWNSAKPASHTLAVGDFATRYTGKRIGVVQSIKGRRVYIRPIGKTYLDWESIDRVVRFGRMLPEDDYFPFEGSTETMQRVMDWLSSPESAPARARMHEEHERILAEATARASAKKPEGLDAGGEQGTAKP